MTNLMPFSDFEAAALPLSYVQTPSYDTAHVLHGTRALKQTLGAPTAYWSDGNPANKARWVPVSASTQYTISIYAYVDGAMQVRINIEWTKADDTLTGAANGTFTSATVSGWQRFTTTGTSPALTTNAHAVCEIQSGTGGASIWYDQAQFETGSSATTWGPGPNDGKALYGTAAVAFSAAGALTRTRQVAGTADVTFSASGSVGRAKLLAGTADIAFSASGSILKPKVLAGTASVVFSASGTLRLQQASFGSGATTAFTASSGRTTAQVLI